jgi:DNA polymerase III sliding clamp (beta) subunit (PCNA family)
MAKKNIDTYEAYQFCAIEEFNWNYKFLISSDELVGLLDIVKFAMSTEAGRPYLCGSHLHLAEEGGEKLLTAVATNEIVLAINSIKLPQGAEFLKDLIIPSKAVSEICKMCKQTYESVEISVSEPKIQFEEKYSGQKK